MGLGDIISTGLAMDASTSIIPPPIEFQAPPPPSEEDAYMTREMEGHPFELNMLPGPVKAVSTLGELLYCEWYKMACFPIILQHFSHQA